MLHDMRGILQNPNYVVSDNNFTEKTILLSAEETQLLRASQNEVAKEESMPLPTSEETNIYEEVGFSEEDEEDEGEVSTFYKIVASLGGILVTLALVVVISLACVWWLPNLAKGKIYSVPNVVEMTLEKAQETLNKNSLKYKVIQLVTDETENGIVVDQDPAAGTEVKKNSYVTLTVAVNENNEEVATETEDIAVSSFVNKESSVVMSEIVKLGLQVGNTEFEYHDSIESGKVISHTPSAGTMVQAGAVIDLVISKGSEKEESIAVPNVVGDTVDEARAKLESMNLRLGQSKEEYSDTEAGYIIRQSLSVGTTVEAGTKVDVTVSKGPKEPEVTQEPDVTEEPEESTSPETSTTPEEQEPVTISRLINLPSGAEEKSDYHVLVKLTLDDGTSQIVTDQAISYDNFPYSISLTGVGSGTIDVFIDNALVYQDPIIFQ